MDTVSAAPIESFPDRIAALIRDLSHKVVDIRCAAVYAVVRIGRPAVEHLMAALDDRDSVVRLRAAWALGRIGDERGAGKLIKTFRDGDWPVRLRAGEALGSLRFRGTTGLSVASAAGRECGCPEARDRCPGKDCGSCIDRPAGGDLE